MQQRYSTRSATVDTPPGLDSLSDYLRHWAKERPDHPAYVELDRDTETRRIPYAELSDRVESLGKRIAELTQPGARVLLLLPTSVDYLEAFLACLTVGRIAVTGYPPVSNKNNPRIQAIIGDATPSLVLFKEEDRGAVVTTLESLREDDVFQGNALSIKELSAALSGGAAVQNSPSYSPDFPAFLQYTSGSTGNPRGVIVTHDNLVHNSRGIYELFQHNRDSRVVSWLPLYHDMGLIGGALQSLYGGFTSHLLPHSDFLQRPIRWLRTITRYAATSSGAPNFAFQYCVDKISDTQLEDVDLSSWLVAYNGAENVNAYTLQRFTERFTPYGFRESSLFPCYGLAEGTLMVTGSTAGEGYVSQPFDPERLKHGRLEKPVSEGQSRTLVSSGHILPDSTVLIVDPNTKRPQSDGYIGEIWASSRSIAAGYWKQHEASERTFKAQVDGYDRSYLRTGDLGGMIDGELYVTGRLKDLIIINGANFDPADIEQTLIATGTVGGMSGVAAFELPAANTSRLAIAQEINSGGRDHGQLTELVASIRREIFHVHGLLVQAVFLLRSGAVPRTSSGKIRRHQCSELFSALIGSDPNSEPEFARLSKRTLAISIAGEPIRYSRAH